MDVHFAGWCCVTTQRSATSLSTFLPWKPFLQLPALPPYLYLNIGIAGLFHNFQDFVFEFQGSDISVTNTSQHSVQQRFHKLCSQDAAGLTCNLHLADSSVLPSSARFPATAANNICERSSLPCAAWTLLTAAGYFTAKSQMRLFSSLCSPSRHSWCVTLSQF